jgi:ABC-type bacteriocin/lantibiotic exporter with double-glycine peptidase domain
MSKARVKGSAFGKLNYLLKLERKEISAIYFYAVLSGLIQLSLPLGIQTIIGFVMGATMVASVYVLIFLILIGVLLVGLLQINQMKIIEKIQQKIFVRFAIEFAEKIPNIDIKEIDGYHLPEQINRFFDTLNIQKGFSKMLLDIPIASIQILFGLILLSLYHPLFIVFSIILVAVLLLIFRITSVKGLETSILESEYKYNIVAWFEEMGRVIKSFKYTQGTNLNLIIADEKINNYVQARTAHFNVLLIQFKSLVFFKVSITALMLILGTYLLFEQKINIGQFVASEIVILAIINSLEKLIVSLENVYDVITGLKKVNSIIEIPNEKEGTFLFESDELEIKIENLTFGYEQHKLVFTNLNYSIPSKAITCVSGVENSGKSTFLKLLTGNYRNFEGSIIFNNLSIQNYTLQSLRSKTGIILSDLDIFNGTLYENITMGRSNIPIESIIKLAKKIRIENFISNFSNSFESILDPLGEKLPTSIIKKILLLRALVHDPILLILEEPWLGLDDESKSAIQNYLLEVSDSKTIVIATNDKEFIAKSNMHIDLSNIINFRNK